MPAWYDPATNHETSRAIEDSGLVSLRKLAEEQWTDFVRRCPKADRHNHSMFGTRIEHIEDCLGHPVTRPPQRMRCIADMKRYVRDVLGTFLYSQRGFEFTADWAVRDAIDDGVVCLEMSLDVNAARFYPDGLGGLLRFVTELVRRHQDHLTLLPEVGIGRDDDVSPTLELANECVDSGVFESIDLYGTEDARAPRVYSETYRRARARGLRLKAHVGEFGDWRDVIDTVETLGLNDVQHGIAAARSQQAMAYLCTNGIRLNVCPTSNVMLGRVENLSVHPIRVLVDHGVRVTVNTDDLTLFGESVSEEYLNLYRSGTLSLEELELIRIESLR
jgi:adenosine deaminase